MKDEPDLSCIVFEWNWAISNNKGISFWNVVQNSELRKVSPLYVDCRRCCQLSSTDHRRQFITLSVHRCVKHDELDAARRADSSAAAESCHCSVAIVLNSTASICFGFIVQLENCPRLRIEVPPTAFRTETLTLTLTLTSDLDVQSWESYGHDPYTCKMSRSKVTRFKS